MKTESRIQVAANTVKEKYKSPACVISPGSWLLNSKPKPQSGSRQSEDIFILFKKKIGTENSDSFTTKSESHSGMSDSLRPHGLYSPGHNNSPGHNTGVVSLSLLQGSFPTQESNCITSRFFTNWSPSPFPLPKFMPPSFHIWIIASLFTGPRAPILASFKHLSFKIQIGSCNVSPEVFKCPVSWFTTKRVPFYHLQHTHCMTHGSLSITLQAPWSAYSSFNISNSFIL